MASSRGKIWTTKKINDEIDRIDKGLAADYSPFYDGKTDHRQADIVFEYTDEELQELARCASDVVYFGDKYCFSMTDEGIRQIKLRTYQRDMLRSFQENRFSIMLASRQIGKCLLYGTKIIVKPKEGKAQSISIGQLYFLALQKERPLKFIEKLKWLLWKIYDKL